DSIDPITARVAGRKPIEARKNEPIKIAENKPLWRFSLQHIELVAKRQDLRFERGSRPKKPGHHPPDQFQRVSHEAENRPTRGFMPAAERLREGQNKSSHCSRSFIRSGPET